MKLLKFKNSKLLVKKYNNVSLYIGPLLRFQSLLVTVTELHEQ